MEPTDLRNLFVPSNREPGVCKEYRQRVEMTRPKRRVSFGGRNKVDLDADMDNDAGRFEPRSSTGGKDRWFRHFSQPHETDPKFSRPVFTSGRNSQLYVIKPD